MRDDRAAGGYLAGGADLFRLSFGDGEALFRQHLEQPFPNGIPAFSVPYNQPDVSVTTTVYQSYFTSGPIPANAPVEGTSQSTGDRHVLIYRASGRRDEPALYEMWQGFMRRVPDGRIRPTRCGRT
jgi:hypothetical protein